MTRHDLKNEYFNWMYQLIEHPNFTETHEYYKLLNRLYETDFYFHIHMDSNRAKDGIDFRYRFGYENGYDNDQIRDYLGDDPCNVLEMMVALAFKCENRIMEDQSIGNRTAEWFWEMIMSLGLQDATDDNFDSVYVDEVIVRFLERDYKPNGEGGLFTVNRSKYDMRTVDIWYQMCFYLDDFV